MRRFFLAISVVGVLALVALAGCGGGGGGSADGGGNDNPPPLTNNTILTGKVQTTRDGSGLANVTVKIGSPTTVATTKTDVNGNFKLDIGSSTVLSINAYSFSVDTSTADPVHYPNTWKVTLNNTGPWLQVAVPVRQAVLMLQSKDLGIVEATYVSGDDPNIPPPPPQDDDDNPPGAPLGN